MGPSWRKRYIRRSAEIQALIRGGARQSGRQFTVFFLRGRSQEARFAVLIPRRYGSAVQRNHGRRVIREIVRVWLPVMRNGVDFLIIPKRGQGIRRSVEVRQELRSLLEQIGIIVKG